MTKLALLTFVFFLSFASAKAQKEKDNVSILNASRLFKSENGKVLTLEGNVSLSTQRLTISKAEKIIIDNTQRKIMIYGAEEYNFDGKVEAAAHKKISKIEYSLGDDTLYLK